VDELKPVQFKFKQDKKESIGLIAHELQEYYPFLVEGVKDGKQTQSVNYNGLIGVLIKEIQELKKRVQNLENKIE
jgi:flagellar biosynthesis chaperone FliJ